MRWLRRSTTTRRGLSLIEVVVASAIFLGMTSVIFALFHQNQRASEKVFSNTDAGAQSLLVFEKVRSELRNARVVGVDSGGRLQYWVLRRVNGVPQVNSSGLADWLPGQPANPAVALLFSQDGLLWRSFQGQRQPLAPLGDDGSVQFLWNAGLHLVTVSGQVGQTDPHDSTRASLRSFNYTLHLSNNE